MISSYLRTAFRNMRRQKLYTAINVIGLSVTLMVCIFIFLFVRNEFSYDTFLSGHQRIYRVLGRGWGQTFGRVAVPWREARKEIPQIDSYTRIWEEKGIVKTKNKGFKETISFVDSGFFSVFPFPMLFGSQSTALCDIHSAVLSREMAYKLFGRENPVGKLISIRLGESFTDFIVSGVAAGIPPNSSIDFSVLIPYSNLKYTFVGRILSSPELARTMWGVSNLAPSAFVRLENSSDRTRVENLLQLLMKNYLSPLQLGKTRFVLQPIEEIHLSSDVVWNMQEASNPQYSLILLGLAALILLTTSINFINLTIARSSHRFKEIGVRKVIGASRMKLIYQFVGEAILLSLGSLLIAIASTELLLPVFNQLTGRELTINLFSDWSLIAGLVAMAVLVGIVSGAYPSIYLSRFDAAEVFRGNQKLSGSNHLTRGMMVFQFVVSAGLLISAIIMLSQFDYIQAKNLGFDKENVIVIDNPFLNNNGMYSGWRADAPVKTFMDNVSDYSGVMSATSSTQMPGQVPPSMTIMRYANDSTDVNVFAVGDGYIRTLGLTIVSGRDFTTAIASDTINDVIVNETLVKKLHIRHPLGAELTGPMPGYRGNSERIIGVVKDFNYEPLSRKISPIILTLRLSTGWNYVMVRTKPGNYIPTIAFLRKEWKQILPGMPFQYTFLDEYLNGLYASAERWNRIIDYSTIFAILIAFMGLFGLASYSVERRTKEIGIRRIMGAKSRDVLSLIYGEFFWLILIAAVLACPAAWYFMHRWLQDFAYRVDITIWPFVFTSLAILLATLVVTMVHVVRAARANPVESLRYE